MASISEVSLNKVLTTKLDSPVPGYFAQRVANLFAEKNALGYLPAPQISFSNENGFVIDVQGAWRTETKAAIDEAIRNATRNDPLLMGWKWAVVDSSNLELPQMQDSFSR